jgi:response regulator RpfG family c-di-GMP phosphodiesterase
MPQASTLRVLCVDDQESMLALMKFAFNQIGVHNVNLAESAYDAEALLREDHYDQFVTMPFTDGLTFYKRVHSEPDTHLIPVIMVTGNADIEHVKTAMAAGLRFFLRKPVKPADLKLRVEAAVGKLA